MEIQKKHNENKAIHIGEQDIRYFHNFLCESYINVNYRAKCIDDSTINFINLDELLFYENPDFRKIKYIEIFADNDDNSSKYYHPFQAYKNYFHFTLGERYSSESLSFEYNSTDINKANGFEKEVKSRIKEIRPWYWFLSKFDFVLGISLVLVIASMIIGIISIQNKIFAPESVKKQLDLNINEYIVVNLIGMGLIYAISYPLNKLKKYLFPKVIIELGRQKKKNKKRLQVIYLIVTVILLGLTLNVMGGFVYDLLKK